jgi:hypothetical protein
MARLYVPPDARAANPSQTHLPLAHEREILILDGGCVRGISILWVERGLFCLQFWFFQRMLHGFISNEEKSLPKRAKLETFCIRVLIFLRKFNIHAVLFIKQEIKFQPDASMFIFVLLLVWNFFRWRVTEYLQNGINIDQIKEIWCLFFTI